MPVFTGKTLLATINVKSRALGVCKVIYIPIKDETISSVGAVFVACSMDLQVNMMIFLLLWMNRCPTVFS